MSKDESAGERAAREKFERSLQEMEAAAAELVEIGDALFKHGEPSDPAFLPRYQMYKRVVKAALALPMKLERAADNCTRHSSTMTENTNMIARNHLEPAGFSQYVRCAKEKAITLALFAAGVRARTSGFCCSDNLS
jgi:hypothetical protein